MYSVRKKYRALPIEIHAKQRSERVTFSPAMRHLVIINSHLATQLAILQYSALAFSRLSAHRALVEGDCMTFCSCLLPPIFTVTLCGAAVLGDIYPDGSY